jgi:peptidoglycan hydrolase-like protein with peptidoglycan-binding domain
MHKLFAAAFVSLLFSLTLNAQAVRQSDTVKPSAPRGPVFRANKEQVAKAQKMLRVTESGKLDGVTREAVKGYQSQNGLRPSGTLNRATLEKMGIALTESQKAIPVSASSFPKPAGEARTRGPVFRATKEQISQAQKIMKARGLFRGSESGKLDDATRDAVRSYQETSGLKVTGTLNAATLAKMGITLTDKQRENAIGGAQ